MRERKIIPFRPPVCEPEARAAALLAGVHVRQGGRRLLTGIDLRLEHGGVTALIGPNGAGKSLILRLLAGLIPPDRGSVALDPTLGPAGLVFQRPVLLRRSVRANLSHALGVAGVPRRARPGRVAELLVMAGLADQSEAPARRLSGGEQQRLQMVRVLAARPRLLLLDEPTASLDPASTAAIESLTLQAAGQGVTVVLVTHDQAQAQRMARDVVFLNRGRVVETAPARAFFEHPASDEAAAYLRGDILV